MGMISTCLKIGNRFEVISLDWCVANRAMHRISVVFVCLFLILLSTSNFTLIRNSKFWNFDFHMDIFQSQKYRQMLMFWGLDGFLHEIEPNSKLMGLTCTLFVSGSVLRILTSQLTKAVALLSFKNSSARSTTTLDQSSAQTRLPLVFQCQIHLVLRVRVQRPQHRNHRRLQQPLRVDLFDVPL